MSYLHVLLSSLLTNVHLLGLGHVDGGGGGVAGQRGRSVGRRGAPCKLGLRGWRSAGGLLPPRHVLGAAVVGAAVRRERLLGLGRGAAHAPLGSRTPGGALREAHLLLLLLHGQLPLLLQRERAALLHAHHVLGPERPRGRLLLVEVGGRRGPRRGAVHEAGLVARREAEVPVGASHVARRRPAGVLAPGGGHGRRRGRRAEVHAELRFVLVLLGHLLERLRRRPQLLLLEVQVGRWAPGAPVWGHPPRFVLLLVHGLRRELGGRGGAVHAQLRVRLHLHLSAEGLQLSLVGRQVRLLLKAQVLIETQKRNNWLV